MGRLSAVVLAASAAMSVAQTENIVQIAQRTPELRTLVRALTAGGLVSALEGPGPFTVFAPINAGFDALGPNILDFVLNPHNLKDLDNILTYHVASGIVLSNQLTDGQMIPTLDAPESVTVHIAGGVVTINDNARVVQADIRASNGVIHLVNNVLVPTNNGIPAKSIVATAQGVSDLSTLVTAVVAANLTAPLSTGGPFTVFAPSNAAFAALPAGTLDYLLAHPAELRNVILYHALPRRVYGEEIHNFEAVRTVEGEELVFFVDPTTGAVSVNNATVTTANVDCSNGVVHLINGVLLPKATVARAAAWRAAAAATGTGAAPTQDIVQLAQATPSLSTLVAAVVAGDLVATLESPGPFTVLAPSNTAFAALPTGVLDYLLRPANKAQLVKLLTYHVIAGNISSSAIQNDQRVPTVEGDSVVFHVVNGPNGRTVIVNAAARVTSADNYATNGVVHIINEVLLPRANVTMPAPAVVPAIAPAAALRGVRVA